MTANPTSKTASGRLRAFLAHEAFGGILLMAVALIALLTANSSFAQDYFALLAFKQGGMSVLHWINDGLMAVFFLLVGLEIKREILEGQLSTSAQRILPGVAAVGGMAAPAVVYLLFHSGQGGQKEGWAVPAATDIAFALGVLALLGSRVPASLKVFLTALAIIDDLGAVLIIAFFYSSGLKIWALGAAVATAISLALMNRAGVTRLLPFLVLGILLWFFVLKSGIHATLAGVILAFAIPLKASRGVSPLFRLEHGLHPWVTYLVIPIFGFANAGVSFSGLSLSDLAAPVPLAIALGLFAGKQTGVFLFSWAAIRLRFAALPEGASWLQLYGLSVLCGIGFTMSLFIGMLAFSDALVQDQAKLGVIIGSVFSALTGAVLLIFAGRKGAPRPLGGNTVSELRAAGE